MTTSVILAGAIFIVTFDILQIADLNEKLQLESEMTARFKKSYSELQQVLIYH